MSFFVRETVCVAVAAGDACDVPVPVLEKDPVGLRLGDMLLLADLEGDVDRVGDSGGDTDREPESEAEATTATVAVVEGAAALVEGEGEPVIEGDGVVDALCVTAAVAPKPGPPPDGAEGDAERGTLTLELLRLGVGNGVRLPLLPPPDALPNAVQLVLRLGVGVTERDGDTVGEDEGDGAGVGEVVGTGDGVGTGEDVGTGDGVGDCVGVIVAVAVAVPEVVELLLGLLVASAVSEGNTLGGGLGVALFVRCDTVAVLLGVSVRGLRLGEVVGVRERLDVPDRLREGDDEGEGEAVGTSDSRTGAVNAVLAKSKNDHTPPPPPPPAAPPGTLKGTAMPLYDGPGALLLLHVDTPGAFHPE